MAAVAKRSRRSYGTMQPAKKRAWAAVRKSKAKRYRRRRRKVTRKRRYGGTSLLRFISPFRPPAKIMYCKFHYVEPLVIPSDTVANAGVSIAYVANGPYDPYYSVGGVSAFGFAKVTALGFLRITALASKIKVIFTSNKDTPVYGVVSASISPTAPVWTESSIKNAQNVRSKLMPMRYGGARVAVKMYTTQQQWIGQDDDEDTIACHNNANPATQWYYHVGSVNPALSTPIANGNVMAKVHITFYCKCWKNLTYGGS